MIDEFMTEGGDDPMKRRECPHCGKGFDVVENWESEGLICPHCGVEIENE